jgi:uncharacterized protein YndB with AHSA1/START domain
MPVSPERLWDALTDPDEAAGWMGGRVEWELEEGAAVRFRSDDGAERAGRVEVVRPGRHLRFRWWPVPTAADPGEPGESVVSYVLEEDAEGTRLTVQEQRVEGPQASAVRSAGWTEWDGRLLGVWASAPAASRA